MNYILTSYMISVTLDQRQCEINAVEFCLQYKVYFQKAGMKFGNGGRRGVQSKKVTENPQQRGRDRL